MMGLLWLHDDIQIKKIYQIDNKILRSNENMYKLNEKYYIQIQNYINWIIKLHSKKKK